MKSNLLHFVKYSVAPCPSRDYYGIKVLHDKVILYIWKVSYGPHLFPVEKETEFSKFNTDKLLKDEIQQVFGSKILNYVELVTSGKRNTLLTLPICILQILIKYLNLEDICKLFCLSQISNEIFNSNFIWEAYFKKLKRTSELSEMEKNLGVSQGFKQLVKDQHASNTLRESYKLKGDVSKNLQKTTLKLPKLAYNLDQNLSDTTNQNGLRDSIKKQNGDSNARKSYKSLKPLVKTYLESEEKISNGIGSKKSSTEKIRSRRLGNDRDFLKKYGSGEGYEKLRDINEKMKKNRHKQIQEMQKAKFISEHNEQTELLMKNKYLQSMLARANAIDDSDSNNEATFPIKSRNPVTLSPRSIFTKSSDCTIHEIKPKPQKKAPKKERNDLTMNPNFNINTLLAENKNEDELNTSGMSYIMKKYLQMNNEASRRIPDYGDYKSTLKNSSSQSNYCENDEHQTMTKGQKSSTNRPKSSTARNTENLLKKIKNIKKS